MPVEAFFLPLSWGQRFCIFHPAQSPSPRGLVLYIHPFAEEMNQSRRMAALQSRALARAGYGVLQMDLLGCGDSSGDFADARWQAWVNDVVQACAWLRWRGSIDGATRDSAPLWLWGLRAGNLLCIQAATRITEPCHFLFWQPPASGRLLLQQFLRLRLAADMLSGRASNVLQSLRDALNVGDAVEVAGYTLAAELARGLESATLMPPVVDCGETRLLRWLEVSALEQPRLHPLPAETLTAWQQAGYQLQRQVVSGAAFWQSGDVKLVPALLDATSDLFAPGSGA